MAGGTIELGFLFNTISTKDIDNILENIKNEIEHSFSKITFIDKTSKDDNRTMVYFCMEYDALIDEQNSQNEKEYTDELLKVENSLIMFVKNIINKYSVDYISIDANFPGNEKYLLEDVLSEDIYTVVCYNTDKFNIKYSSWLLDGLRKRRIFNEIK